MKKPVLAIVSQTIRRDLEEPLKYFKKLQIVHFYHDAAYGDMKLVDFVTKPIQYQNSRDLEKKLVKLKPDIIQGPELYASKIALANAWMIRKLAKRCNIPYFFPVFENRPIGEKFGLIVGGLVQYLMRIYGNDARGVINLNRGARNNLIAAGISPDKITRLNWGTWGINLDEFRANPQAKSKVPLVFFVGKISRAKGVDDLIAAWPGVLGSFPRVQLIIAGPPDHKDAQLISAVKQSSQTKLLGPIKNSALPKFFQKAWITVAPSVTTKTWEEQVGMVNLQSMACQTPVITTHSGAIPEYVGENNGAFLIAEHDPVALADTIKKLLSDQNLRKQMGLRARQFVAKNYEVKTNIKTVERYISQLLDEKH